MAQRIVTAVSVTTDIDARPLAEEWVIEGSPRTRSRELARSRDLTSHAMVWDCTAGRFKWDYNKDEALVVLEGEAHITFDGVERRIGPGDVVFFPAGTSAEWHVPQYIRKVAFLKHTMPQPLGLAVVAWNKLLRVVGLASKSPSMGTPRLNPGRLMI